MAKSRRRGRQNYATQQATITLTPLIDMALTLLVIFMVATPMLHRGIKVDLPQGATDELKRSFSKNDVIVYINKQGVTYVNEEPTALSDLPVAIKKIAGEKVIEMVIISADQQVSWREMSSVVDKIKQIEGVNCVTLATQKINAE